MKQILLLSDTHSYIDDRIIHYAQQADEVWHAGDIGDIKVLDALQSIKPVRAVYGNIDGGEIRKECPEFQSFTLEGVSVLMTHIGGQGTQYNEEVYHRIQKEKPGIFICGHSHILRVGFNKSLQVLHLNPGAAGIYGVHIKRTMLRFVLENGKPTDLEVIELGNK